MINNNFSYSIKKLTSSARKVFFITGFALASWAPLIPIIKDRLNADNGTMGVVLLFFGLGSLIMMLLAGILTSKFGCRRVFIAMMLLFLIMLFVLVIANNIVTISVALFFFGAGIGAADVVININGVAVEKSVNKPVMSGFHALFSCGGIVGAAFVSLLLYFGLAPIVIVIIVMIILISIMISASSGIIGIVEQANEPFFVKPKGVIFVLGLICFIAFLMEGSILDWGGIILIDKHNIDMNKVGIGYTIFAIFMTIGRLFGDRVIANFGRKSVLIFTSLIAIAGYMILVFSNISLFTYFSFMLIGIGVANIAPIMFTAAGMQTSMPSTLAVSSVATMGYSGILLGPAIIGVIAQISSLTNAFMIVTLLGIILLILSLKLKID